MPPYALFNRRLILRTAGMLGAQTLLVNCGGKEAAKSASQDRQVSEMVGSTSEPSQTCLLTPAQVEGPYYLPLNASRTKMAYGQTGISLDVNITVVDQSCQPIKGACVEVWHANAQGVYSGFDGQAENTTGQDFLRGEAYSDAEGQVQLKSIYPGWYPGRAVHVHFKVSLHDSARITSQFYLPDEVSRDVYQAKAYQARGAQDTPLAQDQFLQRTGEHHPLLVASVTPHLSGYLARLQITI